MVLFCDLHGHSRKHNVFIYGCDDLQDKVNRFKSRVFPKMLSKNIPSMFSYSSSKFGIHKSKVRQCACSQPSLGVGRGVNGSQTLLLE